MNARSRGFTLLELLVVVFIAWSFRGVQNAFRYGICAILAMAMACFHMYLGSIGMEIAAYLAAQKSARDGVRSQVLIFTDARNEDEWRDTHFRISYAVPDTMLAAGLEVFKKLA